MKRGGVDSIGVGALISGRGGDAPTRCALCVSLALAAVDSKAVVVHSSRRKNSGMLQQYRLLKMLAVF